MTARKIRSGRVEGTEIAVVGGGPTGLTAAITLARLGLPTTLVAPPPRADARTTALLAASVTMFETLGIWSDIEERAAALKVMRIVDDTGRLFRAPLVEFSAREIGLPAFGYNVANSDLDAILGAAATAEPGLVIETAPLTRLQTGERCNRLHLEDGREIEARLVVGADGRNSPCREAVGIAVKKWHYSQSALVLNFGHELPHHFTSTEFHTETGPFTMVPLPGRRSSLVCVERPDTAQQLKALAEDELSREIERRGHSVLGKVTVESERQIYPLSSMMPERFAAARVALVGEAAHVFPPIGAQGLNLGLRDVASLAECVAAARHRRADIGGAVVMAEYDAARRGDVKSRTLGVDLLNRTLISDFLPLQGVRGMGLYLARNFGPLRRMMMREGVAPSLRLPKMMRGIALE